MSSSTESVRVVVLGDEYSVRGDVNSDTTKKVAEYVGQKMVTTQGSQSSRDKLKIAVLSAMNIAGELFEYRTQNEEKSNLLSEYQTKAHAIGRKIDSVLSS